MWQVKDMDFAYFWLAKFFIIYLFINLVFN